MGLKQTQIKASLDSVAKVDPVLRHGLELVGYPAPRHRPKNFSTLLQIITAQQISTHSAAAVWRRLQETFDGTVSAQNVLECDHKTLCAAGLSERKASYAQDLAGKCTSGELSLRKVARMDDEAAIAAITSVRGLGRWSAEIYLLFAEGRPDIWPADDLAIQIAFQRLHQLADQPKGSTFYPLTEKWSPHRGACALLMWKLYGATTLAKS